MTEEHKKNEGLLFANFKNEDFETWTSKVSEEQKEAQFEGERKGIEILLKCYRQDARSDFYHNLATYDDRNAQRLDMLSCICEFLAGFFAYRFDTNLERFTLDNEGKPLRQWRWFYHIDNSNYAKMKVRLKGPLKLYLKEINRRAYAEKPTISQDEIIGMMRVGYQVEQLIENYRSYGHLIQNSELGSGLGPHLYGVLNVYRRIGEGNIENEEGQFARHPLWREDDHRYDRSGLRLPYRKGDENRFPEGYFDPFYEEPPKENNPQMNDEEIQPL